MTNDPKVVDDEAIYAQPKKGVKKAKHDTQANKRKGKSPTGKGKKSRKSLKICLKDISKDLLELALLEITL